MTHRTDRVKLSADTSRCEPQTCARKSTCARYMAALPAHGASISDFSANGWSECLAYISLQTAAALAKPSGRRPEPKEWIGGIA